MSTAARFNQGKTRFGLISDIALRDIAEVYTKGAAKYTKHQDDDPSKPLILDGSVNWKKGLKWLDVMESVQRHIQAFKEGEDFDPEMGTKHLANAAWGLMAILEYYHTHPELDNRHHFYLHTPKIGLDIDEVLADFVGGVMERVEDMKRSTFWHDPRINDIFPQLVNDDEFWLGLKVKTWPSKLLFEPHCYITSRPIDVALTKKWLVDNGFPDRPVYSIGHNQSKVHVAKESGVEIFVDDRFDNFVELNKAGICTYLFDAPHNQRYNVGHKRIKDLSELSHLVNMKFS